jgi:hypothetical protein
VIKKIPSLLLLVGMVFCLLTSAVPSTACGRAGFPAGRRSAGVALYRRDAGDGAPITCWSSIYPPVLRSTHCTVAGRRATMARKARRHARSQPAFGYRSIHGYWEA